jgi:hypothetical protein
MENNEELLIKRKIYIGTVGRLSAILAGLILYFSLWNFIQMITINQLEILKTIPDLDKGNSDIFSKIYSITFSAFGLISLFGLIFLISSIGLIKYKKWGLKIYVAISWLLIILIFTGIIIYLINYEAFLGAFTTGGPINSGMDNYMRSMMAMNIAIYGILLIVILRSLFKIICKLRTVEYKELFGYAVDETDQTTTIENG